MKIFSTYRPYCKNFINIDVNVEQDYVQFDIMIHPKLPLREKLTKLAGALVFLFATFSLLRCQGYPENVPPVQDFNVDQYLGVWYEIARLDHRFERGLHRVTAEYSLRPDGGVRVLNRGYAESKGEWKSAEGKAYFVGNETTGYLRVSFFGPFYGSYVIFEYDPDRYAFVSGSSYDYLWLLSRDPHPDQKLIQRFVQKAKQLGYNVDALIFVEQK